MNVNDQRMLEQMQQMAAGMMATLPQAGQNAEPPKTEKGESFKDLLDKAKDQKVETPKKAEATQEKEPVQSKTSVQRTQKTAQTDPKTGLRQIDVTPEEAALLMAGYARLSPPMEDGTVWMVTVRDENGNPVLPLAALEEANGAIPFGNELFVAEGEWVLDEVTPEITQALEQLLAKTGDPRPMEDILSKLAQKLEDPQTEPELELTVSKPANFLPVRAAGEAEQTDSEDTAGLSGELNTARPLFHDVKAAPVRVGDNFRLDTEAPDMDQVLADMVRYASQEGIREVELMLNPENLGNLTIKLTQSVDGTLQVVLRAATPKAASLLNQHLGNLNAALQGYGQNSEVRVEVQRNEDSQQAQQQQQQTDPNGHNRQSQQQQEQRQEESHSGDFLQKLRLGLFGQEEA